MKYPFEFSEMLLTDRALDVIGFSPYWDGCGDFGNRTLRYEGIDASYRITVLGEKDDDTDGHCSSGRYLPGYFYGPYEGIIMRHLYFLHDLYEDILEKQPDMMDAFMDRLKEVKMYVYIEGYLKFKNEADR